MARQSKGDAGAQATLLDVSEPEPTFAVMLAEDRPMLVVSLGLGRDSVAMLILLYRLGVRPDLILFADTRSEKPETYNFLPTLNAWLRRVGFPEVTVVFNENGKKDGGLYFQLLRRGRLASIAFNSGGCSDNWKQQPQKAYVSAHPLARATWQRNRRVVFAIGYEASECKRVSRATTYAKASPSAQFTFWYPLVERGVDLDGCVELIESEGLPTPLKSACYFCSSSKLHEIEWLAENHPAMMLRALVMEARAIPELTSIKGLGGRQFRWRDLDCAAPFVAEADRIAAELPAPERDRTQQTSERLRRAIERVLAITDEEAVAAAGAEGRALAA